MTITIEHKITLNLFECTECTAHIALTKDFERVLRDSHKNFYCPNGHAQHFPAESEAERLRKALYQSELEKARLSQKASAAQTERDAMALKQERLEREAARLKKRAAEGVCPCCTRTFSQLQRHMKAKHPQYLEQEPKP